jgi:hypothetical protein
MRKAPRVATRPPMWKRGSASLQLQPHHFRSSVLAQYILVYCGRRHKPPDARPNLSFRPEFQRSPLPPVPQPQKRGGWSYCMLRCHVNMHRSLIRLSFRSTFPRPARPTARVRAARSTPSTRSPSTRLERLRFSPRESVVTTESSPVTEVRPSLSSTRRVRHPCFCPGRERISDNQNSQDHQEGCPAVGVHRVQDQGSAGSEALQALRAWVRYLRTRSV